MNTEDVNIKKQTEEEINDSAAKEDNQTKSANENAENEDSATKESDTDELTAVKEELKQLKDSYLRKVAEFENYKKRTLKEKTELILNGSEKTIVAILPVLDDFERAMADKSDDPKVIKEGMQLIFNLKVLV
jgi:molecular chaperone GrpE